MNSPREGVGTRLCVIAQSGAFGGTELHTMGLIRRLVARGYRVVLIESCGSEYARRIEDGDLRGRVDVLHTGLSLSSGGWRAMREWAGLLRMADSRTAIVPKAHNRQDGALLALLLRLLFEKVIVVEHLEAEALPARTSKRWLGVFPGVGLWWYRARLGRRMRSACADKIICVSAAVRDRLVDDWGYDVEKTAVVRNGVDGTAFLRDPESGAAFRQKHRIPQDAFVFGMLCRLSHAKGVDIALEALARLESSLAELPAGRPGYLVVAGEGEERESLEALTARLGLREHVRFVGFANEPKRALSAFDVILYPSRLEGLPLGLLEGMAAGCVPIISRVSGMPEVVDAPSLGWVVPREDPEALAAAMLAALRLDPGALAAMRDAVVTRVETSFDVERSYEALLVECGLQRT